MDWNTFRDTAGGGAVYTVKCKSCFTQHDYTQGEVIELVNRYLKGKCGCRLTTRLSELVDIRVDLAGYELEHREAVPSLSEEKTLRRLRTTATGGDPKPRPNDILDTVTFWHQFAEYVKLPTRIWQLHPLFPHARFNQYRDPRPHQIVNVEDYYPHPDAVSFAKKDIIRRRHQFVDELLGKLYLAEPKQTILGDTSPARLFSRIFAEVSKCEPFPGDRYIVVMDDLWFIRIMMDREFSCDLDDVPRTAAASRSGYAASYTCTSRAGRYTLDIFTPPRPTDRITAFGAIPEDMARKLDLRTRFPVAHFVADPAHVRYGYTGNYTYMTWYATEAFALVAPEAADCIKTFSVGDPL